jgi:hypothetical protein
MLVFILLRANGYQQPQLCHSLVRLGSLRGIGQKALPAHKKTNKKGLLILGFQNHYRKGLYLLLLSLMVPHKQPVV